MVVVVSVLFEKALDPHHQQRQHQPWPRFDRALVVAISTPFAPPLAAFVDTWEQDGLDPTVQFDQVPNKDGLYHCEPMMWRLKSSDGRRNNHRLVRQLHVPPRTFFLKKERGEYTY